METMRRSVTSTARALGEQATAGAQITAESERLTQLSAAVSQAMAEQGSAASQMAASVEQMRRESDQLARAMKEQSRTIKEMTDAAENIARQMELITRANRDHSTSSAAILEALTMIRQSTDRNVQGIAETRRSAEDLLQRAQSLITIVDVPNGAGRYGNTKL
jgi:methyl-accepting chemotaxis protein